MTSGTSSSDGVASPKAGLFLDTCRRHFWIPLTYLAIQGFVLVNQLNPGMHAADYYWGTGGFDSLLLQDAAVLGYALSLIFCYVGVWRSSFYLFDRSAAPFFGALPIRRGSLFLTSLLAALLPLVAVLVGIALCLLVLVAGGSLSLAAVAQWLGTQLLLLVCFSGVAMLSVQLCGRPLVALVMYCMINGYVAVVELGLKLLCSITLPSVLQSRGESLLLLGWASPGYRLAEELIGNVYSTGYTVLPEGAWLTLLAYALVGVACMGTAAWLFERRDLERAGDGFAFPQVHAVTSVLFSLAAGLGLTLLVCMMRFANDSSPELYGRLSQDAGVQAQIAITLVALCTLAYLVSERILGRDFRAVRERPATFITTVALAVGLAILATVDVTRASRYVPAPEDVASVEVSGLDLSIKDEEGVRAVCNLHQEVIDTWGADDAYQEGSSYDGWAVTIWYQMKDGSYVGRDYDINFSAARQAEAGTAAHALAEFLGSPAAGHEVELLATQALRDNTRYYETYLYQDEVADEDDDKWADGSIVVPASEYPALLAAIRQDLASGGAWAAFSWDDGATMLGNLSIMGPWGTHDGDVSDLSYQPYHTLYLSEERTPAMLAWARAWCAAQG